MGEKEGKQRTKGSAWFFISSVALSAEPFGPLIGSDGLRARGDVIYRRSPGNRTGTAQPPGNLCSAACLPAAAAADLWGL